MDPNGVPCGFTHTGGDARLSDEGPDAELGSFPLKALRDIRRPLPAACRARPVEYPDAPVAGEGVTSVHGTTAEGTAPPVLSLVYTGPGGNRDFALSAVFSRRRPGAGRPAPGSPSACSLRSASLSAGGRRAPPHATPLPLGSAAVTLPGLLGPARLPPWTAFRAPQTPRCRS